MRAIRTIGFTGTIASGKSSRCKRLVEVAKEHQRVFDAEALDAQATSSKPTPSSAANALTAQNTVLVHYINADLVGHSIYEPGKPCYKDLVQHFGSAILSRTLLDNGGAAASAVIAGKSNTSPSPLIDRRVLGEIIFADERKRRELNAICWPYISAAIRAEHAAVCARATASAPPSGVDPSILSAIPPAGTVAAAVALIIVEAALLCEMADVLSLTTDLWMTHCTSVTAVGRLMQRSGLSREAAWQRVASQREVNEKLQTLRELSYKGDIEVFDTTEVSLAEGLKETESAFERYWKKNILAHLSPDPVAQPA